MSLVEIGKWKFREGLDDNNKPFAEYIKINEVQNSTPTYMVVIADSYLWKDNKIEFLENFPTTMFYEQLMSFNPASEMRMDILQEEYEKQNGNN